MRTLALLLVCASTPAMASPDFLDELIPALAHTTDAKAVLAKAPSTVKVTGTTLTFAARDTKPALVRWGWKNAYAVSGDVHQRQFEIHLSTGSIAKDRIATEDPHSGRWTIRVTLTSRPAGPLPALVAGASPAYELPQYASTFDRIEIVLRDPSDLEAALKAIKKPTMADVERELGPPDSDVGSGLHVYEYKLGATTLHVGSPDTKSVMYIRAGSRDLYRR